MLEVGKTYKTFEGSRSFTIVGKKRRSTTGFFFIGECDRTGLIAYFNLEGHHSHQSSLWLDADPWVYLPVRADGTLALNRFVKREELPTGEFAGYLKTHRDSLAAVSFQAKLGAT